ncbi:hypothetical protein CSKR_106767 [Clonorchis sinensis]|uniref:Uncharacterized protein n=1 Tax=Clonorchis sinensis TaxID=79923 RepID=A0A3R7CZQ8_CLOSI|nr:hypothetical protein CSKR_106767 [Clonorchis sinensis]
MKTYSSPTLNTGSKVYPGLLEGSVLGPNYLKLSLNPPEAFDMEQLLCIDDFGFWRNVPSFEYASTLQLVLNRLPKWSENLWQLLFAAHIRLKSEQLTYLLTPTLSRLGQPGSIPALVLPSDGMAARHRKGATAERLIVKSEQLFWNMVYLRLFG